MKKRQAAKEKIMAMEKKDFEAAAPGWDENPGRVRLAGEVAEAIIRMVRPEKEMHVADFGCGTGLLSLRLQPLVATVTGIDSSPGMLDIFKAKIAEGRFTNVQTRLLDMENGEVVSGRYDLIISSMTLHHIRRPEELLRQLHGALNPGGILAVADLDPDDGLFHGDNTGVYHFGFPRETVRTMFAEAGFGDLDECTASEMHKVGADGIKRRFSVFLVTGRKQ
jgi:2-polyprenyl-3-methyl-5-hydroxy-6-metoxy-1,4-benzoquinol methylase